MRILVVGLDAGCSCPPGSFVVYDRRRHVLLCARHLIPLVSAEVADRPPEVVASQTPHTLTDGQLASAPAADVLQDEYRWLHHLPAGARVEVHGAFLWYRHETDTGTLALPIDK